jgi:hypothetical protein
LKVYLFDSSGIPLIINVIVMGYTPTFDSWGVNAKTLLDNSMKDWVPSTFTIIFAF